MWGGDFVLDREGDPLDGEVDPARARQGAGPFAQVAAGVGDPADPVVADEGARQVPEHEPDRPHGEGHHGEQVGGGDDVADVDEVRPGPHRADGEHPEGREGGEEVDDRVENGTDLAHPHVRGAQLVGLRRETLSFEGFDSQRLDDRGRFEGFVGDVGDLRALGLDLRDRGHFCP